MFMQGIDQTHHHARPALSCPATPAHVRILKPWGDL